VRPDTEVEVTEELPEPHWRPSRRSLLLQKPTPFPESFAWRRDVAMTLYYVWLCATFVVLQALGESRGSVRLPASVAGVVWPALFLLWPLIILQWIDLSRRPLENRVGWWLLIMPGSTTPLYYCLQCRQPRGHPLGTWERLCWNVFATLVVLWVIYCIGFSAAVSFFGYQPKVVPW